MNTVIKYTHKAIFTGVVILISTILSFELCYRFNFAIHWCLFFVPLCFTVGDLSYIGCHKMSKFIVNKISHNLSFSSQKTHNTSISPNVVYNQQLQCDIIHYQFENECQHYALEMKKANEEKLNKILAYTTNTFIHLGFNQEEIIKICESVKYFTINKAVPKSTDIYIQYKPNVTQISLKNFAWNIANQHNIKGIVTAEFVITTFSEWFKDSTISTVAKNLRTINGRHMIEIDEHICK